MRFPVCVAATVLAGVVGADAIVIRGAAYTERAVQSLNIRVWAAGESVVRDPAKAWNPCATAAAAPGTSFAVEVREALPVRVEVSAPGHLAASFDVVLPQQIPLPPLWLPAGKVAEVAVTGVAVGVAALLSGTIEDLPSRLKDLGRWIPAVAVTNVEANGVARLVLPDREAGLKLAALCADGRWGVLRRSAWEGGTPAVEVTSRPVAVEVRDERDRPVAGAAVAAATAPAGAGARTDGEGRATIQAPAKGSWAVVVLGQGIAARRLISGATSEPLRLVARPTEPLRVVLAGAGTGGAALASGSSLPAALGGDAPSALSGGAGSLRFLAPGGWLAAYAPGRGAQGVLVNGAESAVAFRLSPAARVEGRVVDEEGNGVAGVPVWSWSAPGATLHPRRALMMVRAEMLQRPLLPAAVSGADGRFAVADLIPGIQRFTASRPGFPDADSGVLGAAAGATVPVSLTFAPGTWLAMAVRDTGGRAVAGAAVSVRAVAGSGPESGLSRAGRPYGSVPPSAIGVTDGEGRARLERLRPGRFEVEIKAPGHVAKTLDATVAREGTDLGVQTLEPGIDVAGRVVDEHEQGVADVDVVIEVFPGIPGGTAAARTDAQGHFVVPDQPMAGEIRLLTRGGGVVATSSTPVKLPPEGPVTVRVQRARALEGRVVDERDGAPVAGVTIAVTKELLLAQGQSFRNVGNAESGEDGAFRVEGIGPGGHVLWISAEGFKPVRLEVDVPEDEASRPVTVIMRRGLSISGRVEEATGAPAAGVHVDLAPAAAEQGSRTGMGMRVDVRTDPEGRFSVEGLDPGRYLLSVGDDAGFGASEIVEAGANEEVVLRLRAPGSLLCRVVEPGGAPVAGAEVMAMPAQTVAGGVQRRTTGPDGAASFEVLAAERHRLQVSADGLPPAMQVVTVSSGQMAEITVTLERGGTLVGRVLGLTAEQLARVSVSVRGNGARVREDGSFTITGVRVGVGQVSAWLLPEGTERDATFEIVDPETPVSVELDFGGGAALAGTVTRGGRGAAGLRVAAVAGRGRATSTVTGQDGSYRLEGIEEGDVVVTVNSDTGATLATRRLAASGTTRADFEIPAGEVVGRVIDAATREGVPQVSLTLRGGSSPPVERTAQGAEDGAFRIGELADGDYHVRATAPGFAPAEERVHVAFGRAPEVTLAMEGEQRLDVTVAEPDGTPCDSFLLVPAADGVVLDGVWARCDRRGRAVVTSLGARSYTGLLVGRGAALVQFAVPSSGVRVALKPIGALVIVAPTPSGPAWRARVIAGGTVVPVAQWSNPARGEWVALSSGTLTVRLPAGEVVVQAVDPDGVTHERRVQVPPGGEAIARFGD